MELFNLFVTSFVDLFIIISQIDFIWIFFALLIVFVIFGIVFHTFIRGHRY